jgi:hypothetical protein
MLPPTAYWLKRGAKYGVVSAVICTVTMLFIWWLATLPQVLLPVVRIPDWLAIGAFLFSAGLAIGLIFSVSLGALLGMIIGWLIYRYRLKLHSRTSMLIGFTVAFISILIIGPLNGEVVIPFWTFDPFSIWPIAYLLYIGSGVWVGHSMWREIKQL